MENSGWIKLHRKIEENWIFQEKRVFSKFEAWLHFLLRANHKDNRISLGNEIIEIKQGSFITSEIKLMNLFNWSKTKLRTFLEVLEKEKMIIKKSDVKKTTISIVNYSVYQNLETTKRPNKNQNKTTIEPNKNTDEEFKNEKNYINNDNRNFKKFSEDELFKIDYLLEKIGSEKEKQTLLAIAYQLGINWLETRIPFILEDRANINNLGAYIMTLAKKDGYVPKKITKNNFREMKNMIMEKLSI
ncbi:MAG: hypothetical protein QMB51_02940 [Patescibacteria group bacterium]